MIPAKYNLRNLRVRWMTTLMTVLSTGLVVWASVLSFGLTDGLQYALKVTGHELDLIVVRKGATDEISSGVEQKVAREVASLPGIAKDAQGQPQCSVEFVTILTKPRRNNGGTVNLIVRGLENVGRTMRPDFKIVQGRDIELCAINLSGNSLGNEDFLEFLLSEIKRTEVNPLNICFEVTETAAIANLDNARKFMARLKQEGVRFSLDDFGTELSSFAYLRELPVDFMKIDGVFIKEIVNDPILLAMVRSINEIGHVMGMQTIAEFVETQEILDKLRQIEVDYAQGYHIGRPRPAADVLHGSAV